MTHAEALAGNTAGLAPSPCPGELLHHERFNDHHIGPDGPTGRTINVWRCTACGAFLSIDTTNHRVLNCYTPATIATAAADLARALDARRALS